MNRRRFLSCALIPLIQPIPTSGRSALDALLMKFYLLSIAHYEATAIVAREWGDMFKVVEGKMVMSPYFPLITQQEERILWLSDYLQLTPASRQRGKALVS